MSKMPAESTVLSEKLRWACGELSRRLRAGELCRAEEFIRDVDLPACNRESVLELLYTEFVVRHELGLDPDPQEWFHRFPQWHTDLEELFHIHQYVCDEAIKQAAASETVIASCDADTHHELAEFGTSRKHSLPGYVLYEELGRGGMGVVYKARQLSVDRIVAVKMIPTDLHTDVQGYRRFSTEAQAAASLHHPHIAQIYEAGEEQGQPFLVMEYVAGMNLESLLARAPLSARAAAELLASLAEAMHYAHQRGVIHRDLKPSNILFTADGQPKISDFGLARRSDAPNLSRVTHSGVVLGTPCYMPPEQAAGDLANLGPHSDVYALGAILYETVTRRPPYTGDSLAEILEQIRHSEPVRPRQLNPHLPRDLETVCLKCLEKQPSARYRSAEAMAQDLRRFLRGEPLVARPSSTWERGLKWTKRHPLVATLIFLIALVTGLGATGMIWQTRRAMLEAEMSRATTRFFDEVLTSVDPALTRGRAITVREMLDAAAAKLDDSLDLHPRIQAGLHETLGVTYARIGEPKAAELHLRTAVRLYETAKGASDPLTLRTMSNLAIVLKQLDRLRQAESLASNGLDMARRTLGDDHRVTRLLMTNLAVIVDAMGRADDAERFYREDLAFHIRSMGPRHRKTLVTMSNLGAWLLRHEQLDEAERLIRHCWTLQRETLGDDHPETLVTMSNLVAILGNSRRLSEARPMAEEMFRLSERVRGPEDFETVDREMTLAKLLAQDGQQNEALKHARHAFETLRTKLDPSHSQVLNTTETLVTLLGLGGDMDQAERIALNSYSEVSSKLGEQHPHSRRVARLLANLYESWERPQLQQQWERNAQCETSHD